VETIYCYKVNDTGWACYEQDFSRSGEIKKYIEFYHTARARDRARAGTMQHDPSA
jgi:hypothetical protein